MMAGRRLAAIPSRNEDAAIWTANKATDKGVGVTERRFGVSCRPVRNQFGCNTLVMRLQYFQPSRGS
jgi:hypothetical protein